MPSDLQRVFGEGVRHHQAGRLDEAEKIYRGVLEAEPHHADGLHYLGLIELQSGRHQAALAHIERAIALTTAKPVAEYHANLATALRALGQLQCAVGHLKTVVALKVTDPLAHFRLGLVLVEKGDYAEALPHFKNAIDLKPDFSEAHSNLGAVLKRLGRFDEAIRVLKAALALQPREAAAHYALGIVFKDVGRIEDATARFQTAVTLDPTHAGAQWNTALAHLLSGDFAEGWKTYDWHTKIKGAAALSFAQPAWDGGDLSGKTLLLYEEHGYGDTLQFVRYVRDIKARGARVLVSCRPEIARLLSSVPGVDAVVSGGGPLPPFDCHASFFVLPKLMGTLRETIPGEVPYIFPEPDRVASWRNRGVLKDARNAGIVWRGNKNTDPRRAVSAAHIAKICAAPGTNWLSLQVGLEPEEASLLAASGIRDCGGLLSDWADTAALISTLDLVVTIDTGVAHLAGALGKPVWILLPFVPDWRWLLERTDSPWYPTARLFRQPAVDDWETVITAVAEALRA